MHIIKRNISDAFTRVTYSYFQPKLNTDLNYTFVWNDILIRSQCILIVYNQVETKLNNDIKNWQKRQKWRVCSKYTNKCPFIKILIHAVFRSIIYILWIPKGNTEYCALSLTIILLSYTLSNFVIFRMPAVILYCSYEIAYLHSEQGVKIICFAIICIIRFFFFFCYGHNISASRKSLTYVINR